MANQCHESNPLITNSKEMYFRFEDNSYSYGYWMKSGTKSGDLYFSGPTKHGSGYKTYMRRVTGKIVIF